MEEPQRGGLVTGIPGTFIPIFATILSGFDMFGFLQYLSLLLGIAVGSVTLYQKVRFIKSKMPPKDDE